MPEGKILKKLISLAAFVVATFAATAAAQAQPSPVPSASPAAQPPMNPSVASPTPAAPAAASPSPSPSAPPHLIQFSGFGDAAYTSRAGDTTTRFSNSLADGTPVGAPYASRVFDWNDRNPDLQNLNVQAALNAGNLTGKLELSAGTDADIIASYPGAFNGFDVTQAYLAYQLGKLSLQGGKFETLAGAEVIESPSNLNYSRSILFGFAVPFTHTGGRLTYAVTPHVNVIGGVNAGWDEIRSTNGRLTAEYGFAFNPSSAITLTAQGYTGIEQLANYSNGFNPYANGNPPFPAGATGNQTTTPNTGIPPSAQGQRTLIDIVGTVHPTSATTLTFNYDHGQQHNYTNAVTGTTLTAGWSGLAGYASYQLNPRFVASARYEGFRDPQGYRTGILSAGGVGPFLHEGTVTLGYNLTSALTLRGEYRHDTADQNVYLRTDGATLSNGNSTYALESIVKF